MSLNIFIPEKNLISAADVKNVVKQGPSVVKIAQESLRVRRQTKPMAASALPLSVDQSRKGCGSVVVHPQSAD